MFLDQRLNYLPGLCGRYNWNYLKINKIIPVRDPLMNKCDIIAFHHLITPVKIRFDPAIYIGKPIRCHSSHLVKPAVNRHTVASLKSLDDHVEHKSSINKRLSTGNLTFRDDQSKNARSLATDLILKNDVSHSFDLKFQI